MKKMQRVFIQKHTLRLLQKWSDKFFHSFKAVKQSRFMDKQSITRPSHITSAGKINHQCLNILSLMFTVILLKKWMCGWMCRSSSSFL